MLFFSLSAILPQAGYCTLFVGTTTVGPITTKTPQMQNSKMKELPTDAKGLFKMALVLTSARECIEARTLDVSTCRLVSTLQTGQKESKDWQLCIPHSIFLWPHFVEKGRGEDHRGTRWTLRLLCSSNAKQRHPSCVVLQHNGTTTQACITDTPCTCIPKMSIAREDRPSPIQTYDDGDNRDTVFFSGETRNNFLINRAFP